MSVVTAVSDTHPVRPQLVQLDIGGMSCAACAGRVESALNKLPGVRASVNFATRVATIDAGADQPTSQLCDAVRRAGYEARPRTAGGTPDVDPDSDHARHLMIRLA